MLRGLQNPARRKRTLWIIVACLAVLVFAAVAAFFFKQYQAVKNNPDAVAKATSKRIVEKVERIYLLPAAEQPTVAQIEDKSKIENQSFFVNAQNGDYLLVYAEAKIALIYREDANRLVNVGPVNTDAGEQAPAGVAGEQTVPNQ